jgi:hypothetical protein
MRGQGFQAPQQGRGPMMQGRGQGMRGQGPQGPQQGRGPMMQGRGQGPQGPQQGMGPRQPGCGSDMNYRHSCPQNSTEACPQESQVEEVTGLLQ